MPRLSDFTPCEGVPAVRRERGCENRELLRDFLRSGMGCARYECADRRSARNYYSCLMIAMKRDGISDVSVCVRGTSVYLSREVGRRAERG